MLSINSLLSENILLPIETVITLVRGQNDKAKISSITLGHIWKIEIEDPLHLMDPRYSQKRLLRKVSSFVNGEDSYYMLDM